MNSREWALVAFTLLMQASAGILVAVVALQATGGKSTPGARPGAFEFPIIVALAASALGLIASLLHLGHPLQAWLALANVRTSWLSREVLLAALFVTAVVAYAVVAGRRPLAIPAPWIGWVAAVLGCALVLAMGRLYMVPAQPMWNRVLTPVGFVATTLLLGVAILIALAGGRGSFGIAPSVERTLAYVALLLVVVQLVLLPAHLATLPREPAAALTALTPAGARVLAAVAACAGLAAIAILVRAARQTPCVTSLFTPAWAIALLALVAIASVAGRVLFYATAVELRGSAGPPL
jgi:anaerobic dimethyl sulfoxide reductase subunit C